MFKRGKCYTYRGHDINYNKKTGQYFTILNYCDDDGTAVKKRIDAMTVEKIISILDTSY